MSDLVGNPEDRFSRAAALFIVMSSAQFEFIPALYLRNRSALAVNCLVIIRCLEVSCIADQITSMQRE